MCEQWDELFRNPPRQYRGIPFWAWNCKVDKSVLDSQLAVFQQMGMGGACIHARIGLATEYLGDEFMALVRESISDARNRGMSVMLYDEDKWPSGFGGGRVTQVDAYRNRYLLFSPHLYPDGHHQRNKPWKVMTIDGELTHLASYSITLNSDGILTGYHRLAHKPDMEREGDWHAYLCICDPMHWFNDQSYVDSFNPEAIKYFSDVTYEVYARHCQKFFGNTVPAIFTDEPQFNLAESLCAASAHEEFGIPYTDDFPAEYERLHGISCLDVLPEIVWQQAGPALHRYQYYRMLAHRFSEAYAGTLGAWCEQHGVLLTGHLMRERNLEAQTRSVGETMESYRYFGLPGIDMLANRYEYATAKQAQSVSRQYGRSGVLSEIYGVTGWDFGFTGHKTQGDWQAALGVTQRVPHLAWMQMGGEAKRDYPAPIDFHSPWYVRYKTIEDHFARVNLCMTQGRPVCRIGILHPIESYWFSFGPEDQTKDIRTELEDRFASLIEILLFNHLDFDFIAESLIEDCYEPSQDGTLHIGQMQYDAVVVPELLTVRSSTVEMLRQFQEAGGRILFLGKISRNVDARPSAVLRELASHCMHERFCEDSLLEFLAPCRDVSIRNQRTGKEADHLLYQLRETTDSWFLFIAQGKPETEGIVTLSTGSEHCQDIEIRIHGESRPVLWDTLAGTKEELCCRYVAGWTVVALGCDKHDSLLLQFVKGEYGIPPIMSEQRPEPIQSLYLPSIMEYRLSEQNVLLLDMPEYALDDEDWHSPEELLRLDAHLRRRLGYMQRTDSFPQPWLGKQRTSADHLVHLRFRFSSHVGDIPVSFVFEGKPQRIVFNGRAVSAQSADEYLDPALKRIFLGNLICGMNEMMLDIPFGESTDIEWCYLVGDFAVEVHGTSATVVAKPGMLGVGDYTVQGFPFYGGDVTYISYIETKEGQLELTVPNFSAPVLSVVLDGEDKGILFKSPYSLALGLVESGMHKLEITAYGSRVNQFGPVHNSNRQEGYWGPEAWRTEGAAWSYSYQLRRNGILSNPLVVVR